MGYALAQMGKRVLLLDGDMQLNLSLSFFPEEEVLAMAQSEKNLYYAIREQKPLTGYIVSTPYDGLDLIPSSTLMSGIEYELFTKWQREMILKNCLAPVRESGEYDYILMDAPPTLGGCVMNLLCAADRVQHSNRVILPKLEEGYTVISDRYFYSCLANLRARGYRRDRWIYEIAAEIPRPDLAFFLDVEVDIAVRRVRARAAERDRYIDLALQHRLREEYRALAAEEGHGIMLSTLQPEEACAARIRREVDGLV